MLKTDEHAPMLLTMPDYNGTLAAIRSVGRQGIPVTLAGGDYAAPGRWSRYVTRHVAAPSVRQRARFLDWLLEFGTRHPGHVLYPTSDDMSWLMATYATELAANFQLFQPSSTAIFSLLDKQTLFTLCKTLKIDAPPSIFPQSCDAACRQAGELGFPLLLKPRTQAFFESRSKGALVHSADQLRAAWTQAVQDAHYDAVVLDRLPDARHPVLQAYRPKAQHSIYSVAGFVTPGDTQIFARASIKVLQRPKKLGVGLCFEHAELRPEILEQLERLCRHVGYFGVFEAEFIQEDERHLMIDFNPRFYGQMGFEIERALPLAYLAYLGALKSDQLDVELAQSSQWTPTTPPIFADAAYLRLVLSLRSALVPDAAEEVASWRNWLRQGDQNKGLIDSFFTHDDRMPGYAALLRNTYRALRHGRSFLRTMVLE